MLRTGCWFFAHSTKLLHFCAARNRSRACPHVEMALYGNKPHPNLRNFFKKLVCPLEQDKRTWWSFGSISAIPGNRREPTMSHSNTFYEKDQWLAQLWPPVKAAAGVRFVRILHLDWGADLYVESGLHAPSTKGYVGNVVYPYRPPHVYSVCSVCSVSKKPLARYS